MIYKEELREVAALSNKTIKKMSEECGWASSYIHVQLKESNNPLSMKIAVRVYSNDPRACTKILPKQRIWVIKEYIENADPKPVLKGKSKLQKVVGKNAKKKAKAKKTSKKVTKAKKKKTVKKAKSS